MSGFGSERENLRGAKTLQSCVSVKKGISLFLSSTEYFFKNIDKKSGLNDKVWKMVQKFGLGRSMTKNDEVNFLRCIFSTHQDFTSTGCKVFWQIPPHL